MDISAEVIPIHLRTDANNLVTTASTTHLPEQKETIHMIQMLRKEASSGAIDDFGHVRTEHCLADCLTKSSVKPDALVKAVMTGDLPSIDCNPPFRSMLKHKAYLVEWIINTLQHPESVSYFLDVFVGTEIVGAYSQFETVDSRCQCVQHHYIGD